MAGGCRTRAAGKKKGDIWSRTGTGPRALWAVAAAAIALFPDLCVQTCRAERQILRLTEAQTRRKVVLVGTMHFNPTSIAKAKKTVKELAEKKQLSSVVIELCDTRWKNMEKRYPKGSVRRRLLNNEMQAAGDVASDYGVNVVLGDSPIAEILNQIKSKARQTMIDIISPINGWKSILEDFRAFLTRRKGKNTPGLSPLDLLDPILLAGLPITLMRYPAAFALKAPIRAVALGTLVYALNTFSESAFATGVSAEASENLRVNLFATVFSIVSLGIYVLLARIMAIVLLMERDKYLANSILQSCKDCKEDEVVVAILGMAHVNGVAQILSQHNRA